MTDSPSGWGLPTDSASEQPAPPVVPVAATGAPPPSDDNGLVHVPDDKATKAALGFLDKLAPSTRPEQRRAYSAVAAEFAALSPRQEV